MLLKFEINIWHWETTVKMRGKTDPKAYGKDMTEGEISFLRIDQIKSRPEIRVSRLELWYPS